MEKRVEKRGSDPPAGIRTRELAASISPRRLFSKGSNLRFAQSCKSLTKRDLWPSNFRPQTGQRLFCLSNCDGIGKRRPGPPSECHGPIRNTKRRSGPLPEHTKIISASVLASCHFDRSQRGKTALDPLPGHYLTIQTSFESSLSFASLARASASEENFTRTLNVAPARSTNVDMKP